MDFFIIDAEINKNSSFGTHVDNLTFRGHHPQDTTPPHAPSLQNKVKKVDVILHN